MSESISILTDNLCYLREKHRFTQADVCKSVHVARKTYSTYETGQSTPSLHTLIELALLYNISLDALVFSDLTDTASYFSSSFNGPVAISADKRRIPLSNVETRLLLDFKKLTRKEQALIQVLVHILFQKQQPVNT